MKYSLNFLRVESNKMRDAVFFHEQKLSDNSSIEKKLGEFTRESFRV